jgi:hypothetical protein
MSTNEEILAALSKAPGPMTSGEVAESLSEHPTGVGRRLYAMAAAGEVEQVDVDGKPAFVAANTGSTPKPGAGPKPARKKKDAPAEKPSRKAKVAKKRAAAKRPHRERTQEHPQPVMAAEPPGAVVVHLQRSTLRTLLAFVFASERPLDPNTRTAAADAAREAA